jgi:sugar lactone lactonase YvrE
VLALASLALIVLIGDALSRRWLPAYSAPLRLATAFLVGLLVWTWASYLLAAVAGDSAQPLVVSNAVLLGMLGPLLVLDLVLRLRTRRPAFRTALRRDAWAWLFALLLGLWVTWMMTTTLQFTDGQLRIGIHEFGDFGPNMAIAQGFALGHNFPTEYPLFAGESILYHFLFYFAAGNLTFLGFDPALANNVLSTGSMVAMLVVLVGFGQRLFGSAAVGRIAAVLFFAHGSLSFLPWLRSFASPAAAIDGIRNLDNYLPSGFPYRGEEWAIWSQNVFLNQRHLASAIGVLLVALLFVVDRILDRPDGDAGATNRWWRPAAIRMRFANPRGQLLTGLRDRALAGYILCGLLLGLLPLWNGAIYVAGAVVLAGVVVLFPGRVPLLALAAAAAAVSLPQILFLRPEGTQSGQFPAFHWGYVVDPATPWNVAVYVGFLFGPKLLLMAVALFLGTRVQRRFFAALCSLVVVAFLVQLTIDISQNHKLLTTWLILGNLWAAFGLVALWRGLRGFAGRLTPRLAAKAVAIVLAAVIAIGGAIDLVPIAHDRLQVRQLTGDRLFEWVRDETDRKAVFLGDIWIHHPVLLAGRRIYLGWPAYPFSMGYDMGTREASYRRLLTSRNPREVVRELQAVGIDYVAFDDGLREARFVEDPNEELYREHFDQVFDDPNNDHRHLAVYRVPTDPDAWRRFPGAEPVDVFTGGLGTDAGRFNAPRGINVAADGSILVADAGNSRIQRFAEDGTFVSELGVPGEGQGQLEEPYAGALDSSGRTWVADRLNDRIQVFDAEGGFLEDWRGPEPFFYGPRDVAIADDDTVFVLDQGRARVVRRPTEGPASDFGGLGAGDGQLNDPTGLGVGGDIVAVADPRNGRIALFDLDGGFLRTIPVPEWLDAPGSPDVAVSADGSTIVATIPAANQVFIFDADGTRAGELAPTGDDVLLEPTAVAIQADGTVLVANLPANEVVRLEP